MERKATDERIMTTVADERFDLVGAWQDGQSDSGYFHGILTDHVHVFDSHVNYWVVGLGDPRMLNSLECRCGQVQRLRDFSTIGEGAFRNVQRDNDGGYWGWCDVPNADPWQRQRQAHIRAEIVYGVFFHDGGFIQDDRVHGRALQPIPPMVDLKPLQDAMLRNAAAYDESFDGEASPDVRAAWNDFARARYSYNEAQGIPQPLSSFEV